MAAVLYGVFHIMPRTEVLGETGRILHLHVPMAWIAAMSFFISAYHSVMVLKNPSMKNDIGAEVSSRLGMWFCLLATVTGAVFARHAWGGYWNWDPRQTSIVVLMLIYMAYFGLRSAISDPDKRMRVAAVYAIFAFFTVPLLMFVIPRMVGMTLHPTVVHKNGMDGITLVFFLSSIAGFTCLYFWLYNLSMRVERLVKKKEGYDV